MTKAMISNFYMELPQLVRHEEDAISMTNKRYGNSLVQSKFCDTRSLSGKLQIKPACIISYPKHASYP